MKNVPDPLLSGKELPTFKFELEKSQRRVIDGSFGKEATVDQLPISNGIAGVSMKLEPGAMRELHWHATAAEWEAHCWNLFHFDVPWNPSRMEQRNGRIDRKLQPNDEVFCHYFVYRQRPEDSILSCLVRKTEIIKHVIVANCGQFGGSTRQAPFDDRNSRTIFHAHGNEQVSISFFEANMNTYRLNAPPLKTPPAGYGRR